LNRNQAEALLSHHDNGVFLIRDSVLYKGRLTLSFINNGEFEHYIIESCNNESSNYEKICSIDNKYWFKSVNDLVKVINFRSKQFLKFD
jgi:hypothetical protein